MNPGTGAGEVSGATRRLVFDPRVTVEGEHDMGMLRFETSDGGPIVSRNLGELCVRAVNSHEALVEALESIVSIAFDECSDATVKKMLAIKTAALALVKGGAK